MKKRTLSVLLTAAMAVSMLAGCGSKTEAPAETAPAATQEVGGETAAPAEGGTLVYWSMWESTEPQGQAIQKAIDAFTAETGIKVDAQFKGRTGIREGLQPALDAGTNIDLFDEDIDRVNKTWGQYLLDLEDMAKDYESEHGNETLFKIARNAYGQTHDGDDTLHSIPYQPSIFGFFYNKTLFTKAGIESVPTTWEELDAACAKLKEAGITPITADDAYLTSFIGYHLARYIGQDGVKSLVTGEEYNGESVTWDDEKVKAAAESFADFAKKGYFSKNIATNKYPAGQNQEFAPGDAAIVICGSWLPNEAKDSVADDLEWGYFNYPSVPDGKDDNTANNIANQVLAINKDSKMSDEAFKLIEYITTGEFDKKMTEEALCIPTDKANADAWPTELSGVKEAFDATTTYYDWAAGVESNNDITPVLQENTQKLASGKLDAAGFIKAMKEAAGQ